MADSSQTAECTFCVRKSLQMSKIPTINMEQSILNHTHLFTEHK